MNREQMYKELVETGSVEVWTNENWSVGLQVWDNGVVHFYISGLNGCGNGMMYSEDDDCIAWDWIPFPKYAQKRAEAKWVKALYWRYKKEFTPSLCY